MADLTPTNILSASKALAFRKSPEIQLISGDIPNDSYTQNYTTG